MLDKAAMRHSHSLAVAVRSSVRDGAVCDFMAKRLRRLSAAADAVRHVTLCFLGMLEEELQAMLGARGPARVSTSSPAVHRDLVSETAAFFFNIFDEARQ
jgi:hypothetical protein